MAKRIIILPGYSLKNKEWADETSKYLNNRFNCSVVYWPHWEGKENSADWIQEEVSKLSNLISEEKVNILSKSLGTYICMKFLKNNLEKVDKLVLCGIPLNDLDEQDFDEYEVLSKLESENVFCIQNQDDHHGSFEQVREFVGKINSDIKVISKPGDTHEYPYSEDFQKFFAS